MAKKKTSFTIDEDVYKAFQKLCIDQDIGISEGIEGLMRKDLITLRSLKKGI